MPSRRTAATWEQEFARWLRPFLDALGHKARRHWAPVYLRGLLGPGERKSVRPMAARVAADDHEQLHHFIATSGWDPAPVEAVLAREAQRLVGGRDAVLIVDDTTLLKRGRHSVGVARQYSGQAGKTTPCQTLVSLTLARGEVPVGLALRLFLPQEWTDDPDRCCRAGVPQARRAARTKGAIALEELDRVRAAGVTFGAVVADTGYGASAEFRRALSARGLTWAVGVPRIQKVYPVGVALRPPVRPPRSRPPVHPVATREREPAEAVLARARWRAVSWRAGTKGPLRARFAAARVVVADGPRNARAQHLPGGAAWLVGEERPGGARRYYLTNHPPAASLRTLAAAIKARWACEQLHQQLTDELGLDHFEGRSWGGLHHHALLTLISFAFLQHLRLRQARAGGKISTPRRPASAAHPAGRPPRAPGAPRRPRTGALPALPQGDPAASAGMKVAK
jgi:SRSO17 transposase